MSYCGFEYTVCTNSDVNVNEDGNVKTDTNIPIIIKEEKKKTGEVVYDTSEIYKKIQRINVEK